MQTGSVKWIGDQKIRGYEPVRTRHKPLISDRDSNNRARPDGARTARAGGLHRHRRGPHPGKEAGRSLESLEVICSGERAGGAAHGSGSSSNCFIVSAANSTTQPLKRAIQLSEDKYCSVAAMLKEKPASLTWRYEILPAATLAGNYSFESLVISRDAVMQFSRRDPPR